MPPARLVQLLFLVIAAAAVTVTVAWGLRGTITLPGGLALLAVGAVALRLGLRGVR